MSQVLRRATRLLAVLGERRGEALTLGEVAAAAALPPATCTRLLRTLVEEGWADQDGRRGAYRIGPRAFALASAQPYRHRLLAAALAPMRALAAAWPSAGVVLVVLRPWSRQVLWQCGGGAGPDGRLMLLAEAGMWGSASGRVLLAALPARERGRWLDRLGLPLAREWRGLATRAEVLAALAEVRRQGEAVVDLPRDARTAVAVPCADGDGGTAALGAYLPSADWSPELLRQLRRQAAAIRPGIS